MFCHLRRGPLHLGCENTMQSNNRHLKKVSSFFSLYVSSSLTHKTLKAYTQSQSCFFLLQLYANKLGGVKAPVYSPLGTGSGCSILLNDGCCHSDNIVIKVLTYRGRSANRKQRLCSVFSPHKLPSLFFFHFSTA